MSSLAAIKERIQSVEGIGQLTRALQAVSSSQVRQFRLLAEETNPYIGMIREVIGDVYNEREFYDEFPALSDPDDSLPVLIIFVSADRGLAGGYPANVFQALTQLERQIPKPKKYVSVGKRGREMLLRRKRDLVADFSQLSSAHSFYDVSTLAEMVSRAFQAREYGEVYLVYTEYVSMGKLTPRSKRLLPLMDLLKEGGEAGAEKAKEARGGCIFDGDPQEFVFSMMRRCIRMTLFNAFVSAKACEHTARMLAMNQATENTKKLLSDLTLEFNNVRQQSITNSILDIVTGSSAMMKD